MSNISNLRQAGTKFLAILGLIATTFTHAHAASGNMIVKPYEHMIFSERVAGMPQISSVIGVPENQASSIVMKMGKGAFPMHSHSANYQLVVIKGVMKHWGPDGSQKSAPKMGPGSFWYQPAGEVHGDACESKECVWFITFDGPRDFVEHK